MNFSDVRADIHKLVGLDLDSIRPGAKITIVDVDDDKGSLVLRTASGQMRSRPIEELQRIWDEMMIAPAVHVEGVLHGSGTSRNQPETILANLPYVEWLKVDNKKHIAYVGKNTHAYGTLKQMDSVSAISVSDKMKAAKLNSEFSFVIVSKDINESITSMQAICPGTVRAVEQGIYQLETNAELVVFVSADALGLEEGTYCVIETVKNVQTMKRLLLYGKYYSVICQGNIKAFVTEKL